MAEGVDELKRFLAQEAEKGELNSVGSFTLDRRKALEKLSAFQLPFAGCWILKLIQAAVASGCCTSIKVNTTPKSTKLDYDGSFDWIATDVLAAILNPDQKTSRALAHLAVGLRVLSFHDCRGWTLNLGEAGDTLTWDGKDFQIISCQPVEGVELQISRDFYGAVCDCLLNRANACPIPLFLRGNRIDSLELNPDHGYGLVSQPLALGLSTGELPKFGIPTGRDIRALRMRIGVQPSLRAATDAARNPALPKDGLCHMAFLLAAHLEREPEFLHFGNTWHFREGASHRYWIYDGVIIEKEPLNQITLPCSIGCFLSAQDLTLDASGFGIKDDAEKRRRIFVSRQLLREGLAKLEPFDYQTFVAHDQNQVRMKSSLFLLGGLLSIPASTPIAGFFMVLGASGLAGGKTKLVKSWAKVVNKALKDLRRSL